MGDRWRDFSPGSPLPSTWTDGVEELLGNYVSPNFVLSKASNTSIQVVAGTAADQVSLGVRAKPRYNTATITATHPGGAAGTYDVWVTASADSFATTAGPPAGEVDNSTKTFGALITLPPATPSGTGSQAFYRRVGQCVWDGTKITRIDQMVGRRQGRIDGFAATDILDASAITGDANARWQRRIDGATMWGGGSATPDTQLERANTGRLRWGNPSGTLYEGARVSSGLSSARPSTSLTSLEGLIYRATDTGMRTQVLGSAWVNLGNDGGVLLTPAAFLALPAQVDGTIVQVQLVVPTAGAPGMNVMLRFNSGSANTAKWEVVGEAPEMLAETTASVATNSVGYTDIPVTLTLPLAGSWGVYVFSGGALITTTATGAQAFISYRIGATAPVDADGALVHAPPNTTIIHPVKGPTRLKTIATAGTVLTMSSRTPAGTITPNNAGTSPIGISGTLASAVGP